MPLLQKLSAEAWSSREMGLGRCGACHHSALQAPLSLPGACVKPVQSRQWSSESPGHLKMQSHPLGKGHAVSVPGAHCLPSVCKRLEAIPLHFRTKSPQTRRVAPSQFP